MHFNRIVTIFFMKASLIYLHLLFSTHQRVFICHKYWKYLTNYIQQHALLLFWFLFNYIQYTNIKYWPFLLDVSGILTLCLFPKYFYLNQLFLFRIGIMGTLSTPDTESGTPCSPALSSTSCLWPWLSSSTIKYIFTSRWCLFYKQSNIL